MLAQTELIPQIPLAEWTTRAVDWITETFEWFFEPLKEVIAAFVGALEAAFTALPALLMVAVLAAIAFFLAGWRVALFTCWGSCSSSAWTCGTTRWRPWRWSWRRQLSRWQ
jgi:ABC-type proline/glycine betaine transport system permease subunit